MNEKAGVTSSTRVVRHLLLRGLGAIILGKGTVGGYCRALSDCFSAT